MSLVAGCPSCSAPVASWQQSWSCPEHGAVVPLWRPREASYEAFGSHLMTATTFPTYLPWPLSPGWRVSDFAVVGDGSRPARATMSCVSGTTELDGPVDLIVVAEEPGAGLGARCASTVGTDPGPDVGRGQPLAHLRIGSHTVALWAVSTSRADADFDRSVLVGEAAGRWLWVVLRPASAILLLRDDWILRDVSGIGPPLVELPFGGPAPSW